MADQKDIDVVKELNDLIQLDFDASKTYEQAIAHIDEVDVKEDLEIFRHDHLRHIDDLKIVVASLGGEYKEPKADVKGLLLEGMTRLRSVTGTMGALKAMRMNEKLTNRVYDKESHLAFPPVAREVVMRNLEDERRHLATIEEHIDRLSGGAEEVTEEEESIDVARPDLQPGTHI